MTAVDVVLAAAEELTRRYRASPAYVVELPGDDETLAAARLTRPHLADRRVALEADRRALCGLPLPARFRILPYPPAAPEEVCRRCAATLRLRSTA